MSIATAIISAQAKVAAAYSKCNDKGATMPQTQDLSNLADTIDNIPQGGSAEKFVNFYDYDGTLLHAYTAEEALELTELPPNPSHPGLVAQGWTWNLVDMKACVQAGGELRIGQMYDTDDGKIRLYIELEKPSQLSFTLVYYQSIGGAVEIDWGDGDTYIDSSSGDKSVEHTYPSLGNYKITLEKVIENATVNLGPYSQWNSHIFSENDPTVLKAAELSASVITTLTSREFSHCSELLTVTMPSGITKITRFGHFLDKLKCFTIPNTVTRLGSGYGDTIGAINLITTIPTSVTDYQTWASHLSNIELGTIYLPNLTKGESLQCFKKALNLGNANPVSFVDVKRPIDVIVFPTSTTGEITIPEMTRSVIIPEGASFTFRGQIANFFGDEIIIPSTMTLSPGFRISGLEKRIIIRAAFVEVNAYFAFPSDFLDYVDLPASVEKINGGNTFGGYNTKNIRTLIIRATTPPVLTSALSSILPQTRIYVPYSADHSVLSAYQSATNWSSISSQIFELDENGEIPTT